MALFRISAPVQRLSPVRLSTWNGTFRAGDDLKVAFTLLDVDCETPIDLSAPGAVNATLALFEDNGRPHYWDYGAWWTTSPMFSYLAASVVGVPFVQNAGQIDFFLPATKTSGLRPLRYRMLISVDLADGVSTQIDGALQVLPLPVNVLGNAGRPYLFIEPSGRIDLGYAPANVIDGVPVDADGFPLAVAEPPALVNTSAVLGIAILGQMVLGNTQ